MKVAVLIAGIEDPKWPLGSGRPRILSPFDESALEVALKLRDAEPTITVSAYVAGDEALARIVMAYRPDSLRRVDVATAIEWDARGQAAMWGGLLADAGYDLVLLGREFGDRDDGAMPACLAESLQWRYLALAQEARVIEGCLELVRDRGNVEERFVPPLPLVASVTNDRRNKLRHPLMKNVMAAKRAVIESTGAPVAPAARVSLHALEPAQAPRGAQSCRVLEGPVEARVAELARFLERWRRAA